MKITQTHIFWNMILAILLILPLCFLLSGETFFNNENLIQLKIPADSNVIPKEFGFYPHNPFPGDYPMDKVTYDIVDTCRVKLIVYDISNNEIEILVDEVQAPGRYSVKWHYIFHYPSGVYYYMITAKAGNNTLTDKKKFVLVK